MPCRHPRAPPAPGVGSDTRGGIRPASECPRRPPEPFHTADLWGSADAQEAGTGGRQPRRGTTKAGDSAADRPLTGANNKNDKRSAQGGLTTAAGGLARAPARKRSRQEGPLAKSCQASRPPMRRGERGQPEIGIEKAARLRCTHGQDKPQARESQAKEPKWLHAEPTPKSSGITPGSRSKYWSPGRVLIQRLWCLWSRSSGENPIIRAGAGAPAPPGGSEAPA